jgi:hypothetical protein
MNRTNPINRLCLALIVCVAAFAAACGGGGSTPVPPPVGNFSNASLSGQYAFSMSGSDAATGSFFARIGSFTADGSGNITAGIEDVNTALNGAQTLAFSASTYTVQADGRGTINLSNATGALSFSITMLSPTKGLIVETDLNATASGTFLLQSSSSFNAAGISGNYVFDFSGLDPAGAPDSIVGQFVSTGSGLLSSGLLDENDGAAPSGASPFTAGSYQMDATNGPTSGRGVVTFTTNGFTFNYIFYIVNGSRVRMMETGTAGAVGLTVGDAISQSSVPATNGNFNGNFAYLLSGVGSRSQLTRIGRFTANGSGGLGSIFADTNDGGTAAQVPSGSGSLSAMTYAIDTNFPGSGRGTLTFTDSKLGTFSYVVYLSSSSGGVMQDVSKNTVADGTLQLQVGAPFSNSSFAGNYGFNFSGIGNNSTNGVLGEEDYVGQIALTSAASNNVTGAVDFSAFSSNQGAFLNVVVSGNGLTVGGDGTTSSGTRNTFSLKLAGNPSTTLNFAAYIVNSQTIFVAGTDSARVISGTVTLQAP